LTDESDSCNVNSVKTIVIEDDLYAHLLSHTREIGESASSIIRRLIGLSEVKGKTALEIHDAFDFLKTPQLFRHLTNTQRFLFILSWAYRKHPEQFERVLLLEGRRRRYFAKDAASLNERGSSVNPRPIPDSPFWVSTNNSTAMKMQILADVFDMLGYDRDEVRVMLGTVLT
jgi:negative modulator of initiation of replication